MSGRGFGRGGYGGRGPFNNQLSWRELEQLRGMIQAHNFANVANLTELLMQLRPGLNAATAMQLAQSMSGNSLFGMQYGPPGGVQMLGLMSSGLFAPSVALPQAQPAVANPQAAAVPAPAILDYELLADRVAARLAAQQPAHVPPPPPSAGPAGVQPVGGQPAGPQPAGAQPGVHSPGAALPGGVAPNFQVLPPFAAQNNQYAQLDSNLRQAVRTLVQAATSVANLSVVLNDPQRSALQATQIRELYEAVCDPADPDEVQRGGVWVSRADAVMPLAIVLWRHRAAFAQA